VNDEAPRFSSAIYEATVKENLNSNADNQHFVLKFDAFDPDSGAGLCFLCRLAKSWSL
jgi:hypothetical protein